MGRIVKLFKDGSFLEYDSGAFDDWCVYLSRPNTPRYAPKDYQYFGRMAEYAVKFGADKLYNDFCYIYNLTSNKINPTVLDEIENRCNKYGAEAINIAIDFTIIYMGMIAEENKAFTRLGKRVKRLGMHQVLIDKMAPDQAANFSRGKKWREIDVECTKKGF